MTDVYTRTIQEHPSRHGGRLGRHVAHDPRSRDFPAEQAAKIVSVAHRPVGLPLDQGNVGKCTCEAFAGAHNSKPNYLGGEEHVMNDQDTDSLYELETKLEGSPWTPGNEENDIGGTGLMVCKAAKQMGLVRSYHHAFGLDHSVKALVLRPVLFGFDWYEGFDSPDSTGLVKIAGSIRGGHEIVALGIDAPGKLVWFANSWGADYGVRSSILGIPGCFAMSFDTIATLLGQEGDCTVPLV